MIIYANNNTVCRTALACSLVKLEKLATLLADLQTSQLWKLYSFAFWTGLNMVLWWIIKYFSPRKVLYVERLIIHQDYSPTPEGYFNDIALIKLSNKLDLGVYVPAGLIPRNTNLVNMNGWVYGWGSVDHNPTSMGSNILRQTTLTINRDDKCGTLNLGERMICGLNNEYTACLGDSGGPLTVEIEGKHYLSGIVSVVEGELCPIQLNEGPIQLC